MKDIYAPKPYQIECVNNVLDKICNGYRRVSVLIPTGAGKTYIATMLVEKVCTTYQKAVFVVEYEAIKQQCNNCIDSLGIKNASCQTVKHFLDMKENYEMVVLLDVRPALRVHLEDYFKDDERTIIVSLGAPNFAIDDKGITIDYLSNDLIIETTRKQNEGQQLNRLLAYYTRMGEYHPLVYATKELIDVRDVFSATKDEKEELTQQILEDKQKLSHDIFTLTKGLQEVPDTENVCELKSVIQLLQRKLTYQTQLLASVGIPQELIDEEFKKIEELREELSVSFYDAENNIVEATMAQFETAVAESVAKLTKKIITLENFERYEDILKSLLSEKVWKMLSDNSRNFLITAKMNYEAFARMESGANLDYSGVCLLVTKVLDIEITKRLYEKYGEYLQERYGLELWPKAMLNKQLTSMLEGKDFTLGTVAYVIGCNRNGVIKDESTFDMFKVFAKEELYVAEISNEQCEQKIKNIVKYVEKVRVDYRNPAAHRNSLNAISAEACMGYMIETYKKLKEILEDMKC